MKQSDLEIHARVFERAKLRIAAMPASEYEPAALGIMLMVASMIEQEYKTIGQVVALEPENAP